MLISIAANIVFWLALHVFGAAIITSLTPRKLYVYTNLIFKERPFENRLYTALRIKRWKDSLPIYRHNNSMFDRKHLNKKISREYLDTFIVETCKAEFVHLIISILGLSSVVFVFMEIEAFHTFLIIVMIMLCVHAPFIMVQRYNRFRMVELRQHFK
jgi:glycosyl-4,4'-diaponeurosporenoate acyltransferase